MNLLKCTGIKKNRESNIELLRIFATVAVIILHFNYNGALDSFAENTGGYNIYLLLECLCVCAVDVFVFISGYFSWKVFEVNVWKCLRLVIELITINIIWGLVGAIKNHNNLFNILWLIPNNYYVIFYVTLMFLLPYINKLIDIIKNKKIFLLIIFFWLSVYPTIVDFGNDMLLRIGKSEINDISSITRIGSLDGYTIINFIMMYMIGCIYHHCEKDIEIKINRKRKILILVLLGILLSIFVWSIFSIPSTQFSQGISLSYANPLIIMEAILLFMIFKGIRLKSLIVNAIAKASFTVYLVHGRFIKLFVSKAPFDNTFLMILYTFIGCVVIYTISYIIFLLYHLSFEILLIELERRKPIIIKIE